MIWRACLFIVQKLMANIYQNWIKTFESIVWKILSYSELSCGWKWNPIQVSLFAKVEEATFKWQALKTMECEKRAATFRNNVSGSVQIVWDVIVMVHAFDKDGTITLVRKPYGLWLKQRGLWHTVSLIYLLHTFVYLSNRKWYIPKRIRKRSKKKWAPP